MDYLLSLLPKLEHWKVWLYWIIGLVSILESTAFIGLIIPGTTVTVFAGFLAAQNIIDLSDLILFVTIGGIIGDAISYCLGTKGIRLFSKEGRFFKTIYLIKGEEFFEKHGEKSVVLARFIGPIRPIVPFIAGLSKMKKVKFFIYNVVSGFLAAIFYIGLGYFFGQIWGRVSALFSHFQAAALIITIVLIIGYFIRNKLFKSA